MTAMSTMEPTSTAATEGSANIGGRGPLDPLLFMRAQHRFAQTQPEMEVHLSDPRRLTEAARATWEASKARNMLVKARAFLNNSSRRLITAEIVCPQDPKAPCEDQEDPNWYQVPETVEMHERWQAALNGRRPQDLPLKELRYLVDSGIPLKQRHALWPEWWEPRRGSPEVTELENSASEAAIMQIERDVNRTLPRIMEGAHRELLTRVLRAYAALRPEVGYCQGMSFLAAVPVLLGFDASAVFNGLCYVANEVCPDYHGKRLEGYFRDLGALSMLMNCLLPDIQRELDDLCLPLHMLATDHLLTLSARTWPLAAVVRLWDVVLMEGSAALLSSFLALLQMYFMAALAEVQQSPHTAGEEIMVEGGCAPSVAMKFQEMACTNVGNDVDEFIHKTRKLIPLVRGEETSHDGNFLDWVRAEICKGNGS